ncbi:MAG: uL22 family ribosomal protein [Candidatus Daviesbacteria bacterium]|nr:uL22 family ribosomal protein [Candidatus Daviesbacteria bacterium]
MEITTIQKYIHTTPRKLRLVLGLVRNMEPSRALDVLMLTPKAAAKDLQKALRVVLANAKQQGLDVSKLTFKKVEINESMKMRRFRAGTKGRAKPYKKRMSHIKIVLSDDQVQSANPIKSDSKLKVQNENSKNKEKGGKQTKVVMDNSAEGAK